MQTEDEFARENIYIEVYDANTLFRNRLIGTYTFGIQKVSNQREIPHQIRNRWVYLINPESPSENVGSLVSTVTVLGPNDIPPASIWSEESALDSMVLDDPEIERRPNQMTIYIHRGEHIPRTDFANNSTDPFVVVKFNGKIYFLMIFFYSSFLFGN